MIPETDVCIIGAGPAGSVMAAELAARGVRAIVLEAGPRHDPARRPEYARRQRRGDNPWRSPEPGLDRFTTAGGIAFPLADKRVRGAGGGTLHWEGYALRLHESDLALRSRHGVGEDWPIGYADLEPFYVKAERALGVAGAASDPWASPRSAPFPLPPFPRSHADGLVADAAETFGVALQPMPQARNSIPYGGRPGCSACSVCAACPTGAKATADVTHLWRAEATGLVQVLADTAAISIALDGGTPVVTCAGPAGRRTIAAKITVLAAGAVESARLLLLSSSARAPRGLGNASGLVGRHFMSHPSVDVIGRVRVPAFPHRIGFSTSVCRRRAVDTERARDGAFLLEFLNTAELPPAAVAQASGRWGAALRESLEQEWGRTLGIRIYAEQLPDPDNAVTLDPGVRDHLGLPVPRLTYSVGAYERTALDDAGRAAAQVLRAAGADRVAMLPLTFAGHQLGTCRMGKDPATSVVGADSRLHEAPAVYVVGSAVFPTASALPPTLTIAALAIRAAEDVARRLGRAERAR